nr:hypothetical protein [uncultured Pseudogulbenkiania sp.]
MVNTCGFIDSAVAESLDAIGEALTENGKAIETGCLGAKGEVVRDVHPSVLAVRPARHRRSDGTCACPLAQTARPVRRLGAGGRNQANAQALRLSEDFRRL